MGKFQGAGVFSRKTARKKRRTGEGALVEKNRKGRRNRALGEGRSFGKSRRRACSTVSASPTPLTSSTSLNQQAAVVARRPFQPARTLSRFHRTR
ncbi:U-box domain-containing protein [Psidium guajava]|nr:U-box domain-containing protein [Psidium guajava]